MGRMSKKIKVGLIITKGNWGGAQKYVYILATNLPKDLYDVFVVVGAGKELKERLGQAGIKTYQLQNFQRDISIIKEIKTLINILRILKIEKPDVIHLNSPKAAGLGAISSRLMGIKKIIYTVHGFAFNEDRSFLSKIFIWFISWITIISCHKVIVINEKEKRQALVMSGSEKIVLIKNGITKIEFLNKETAREKLLSITTQQKTTDYEPLIWLGTLAELHKNKGLQYAIMALSKINFPFRFVIIGEGEERKNLEGLIAEKNLKEKVTLLGFIENAEIYLKAFDIFILPSIKEGSPLSTLEAGAAEVPVIATRVGGIPDLIENDKNGIIVTTKRVGELTRAIEYLIQNPEKQKSFGENLKNKIEKDFSVEQMLEKTRKLYG